jgi:hypothetical protein
MPIVNTIRSIDPERLRSGDAFWQYGRNVERLAMRIASSPKRRIAAGLLIAALLSIVGYKVFRRWVSHGPEALLERADAPLRFRWGLPAFLQSRTLNRKDRFTAGLIWPSPRTITRIFDSNSIPFLRQFRPRGPEFKFVALIDVFRKQQRVRHACVATCNRWNGIECELCASQRESPLSC